jgi:mRNA interferase RelE/StbE
MMTHNVWSIVFDPKAQKEFSKLDISIQKKIKKYLQERIAGEFDPRRFGKPLTGELEGLWTYRVESYRILCTFKDHQMIVLVVEVGHRREVYD